MSRYLNRIFGYWQSVYSTDYRSYLNRNLAEERRVIVTVFCCGKPTKAGANEKTLLWKHFEPILLTMLHGWAKGKKQKDANFSSSKYVASGRKRGNNRETFKVCFTSVFPKCFPVFTPTQHVLKTQNLRLESRKCFRNFPKTIFASWTPFCFRNNVSSFAPAIWSLHSMTWSRCCCSLW